MRSAGRRHQQRITRMQVQKIKPSFTDGRGEIIDILKKSVVEYATIITSRKGAVRANHYHKETFQYVYLMSGRMRVVAQMPGEPVSEVVLETGDLIVNVPLERHAFEALDDCTMLVLTRGPRGGDDYESDTFRLEVPLIAAKQAKPVGA
jgi:quercetin dioxygenase-like cupin family protein